MVEHAICIKCGEEKAHPYDRCGCCKLTPTTEEEKMKSLYLSEYRFSDGNRMEKWLEELESIAPRLQKSEPFDYVPEDLKRMAVVEAALKAVPASAAWKKDRRGQALHFAIEQLKQGRMLSTWLAN